MTLCTVVVHSVNTIEHLSNAFQEESTARGGEEGYVTGVFCPTALLVRES